MYAHLTIVKNSASCKSVNIKHNFSKEKNHVSNLRLSFCKV